MSSKKVTRLFTQFQPENYKLHLVPNKETMTFSGTVEITGKKTGRPSQRLTFHQNGLSVTGAEIIKHDRKGDTTIVVDRINLQKSFDEVRLHAESMIYPGNYTVKMAFNGTITRPMNGMYPCYFEEDGVEKVLIATQFESHHAREVFPGIDEPEAKATFDLSLTTPVKETVIANTPIASQEKTDNEMVTVFETTPKMSTYLLAFAYGDIGFKEAKTKDGVLVRTYATPNNVQFTDFALDTAVKVLEFYNEYFGLPYPLPKADMIALPDFASGAMENWGLITYREQCMLVDPANTSLPTKQYVAMVVAHELAHQWFGNLVTMRWWTDLWLNEGFASWIEYLAVDHLFPEWKMWTQFITDEQQTAMRLDALENTHPIEVPVNHPDEIRTIFDTISYAKGASVIHMLHEYLGPTAFRDGLRHYLKQHQYGNTNTIDLWNALEEVSKKPVKKFMHAWTAQPGFPIVTATITDASVRAEQARFYANPQQERDVTIRWPIPLKGNTAVAEDVLTSKAHEYPNKSNKNPLKLNGGQSGFYRVVYNPEHILALGDQVAKNSLEPIDRLSVLSDAIESAKAGYTSTVDALKLLSFYENEDNAAVWDVIATTVGSVRGAMDDDELRDLMKPFVRKLIAKQLKRLGWEAKKDEPYFDQLLRPTILGMASIAEESTVIDHALELFKDMKKPEDITPDLRGVVYNTAARHGDTKVFDKLLKIHNESTLSEERTTLTSALTSFEQPELIERSLEIIPTKDVRLQDVGYWIAYSFMNRHAKRATWKWMAEHWQWLSDNLGSDLSFHRFPVYAARSFSDSKFLPEYEQFFEAVLSPAFERPFNQGKEIIQWQSAWKARDLSTIKQFFSK